jgi:hypothetical protein
VAGHHSGGGGAEAGCWEEVYAAARLQMKIRLSLSGRWSITPTAESVFPDADRCYCNWGTRAGTWPKGSLGSELPWRTGR